MAKVRHRKDHLGRIFENIKNYGRSRVGKSHSESRNETFKECGRVTSRVISD